MGKRDPKPEFNDVGDFLIFSGFLIDYSQLLAELIVHFWDPRRY